MCSNRLPVFVNICNGLNNNIGLINLDDHTVPQTHQTETWKETSEMADDYDSFQPCFYESDMDFDMEFYDAPVHSDDIWKKFELLPTPPRSPKHDAFSTMPSVEEKLQIVSALLDDDPITRTMLFSSPECSCGNLKSKVIKDCMWSEPGAAQLAESFSGYCHANREKMDSCPSSATKKPGLFLNTSVTSSSTSCTSSVSCTTPSRSVLAPHAGINGVSGKVRSQSECSTSSALEIESTECVSPSAVFPYNSLADPRTHVEDTPSPSESSDDEEIDVVTVADKITLTRRKPILPGSSSMSAQVAALHNYSSTASPPSKPTSLAVQRSTQPARSSHSERVVSVVKRPYSKPASPSTGVSHGVGRPAGSRKHRENNGVTMEAVSVSLLHKLRDGGVNKTHGYAKLHHHHGDYKSSSRSSSKPSSRSSSDSEDTERRAAHNDLERKRRDDLRYSFIRLRDTVPTLKTTDRAAKVVILQKASDYIRDLSNKQHSLQKEAAKHRDRNEYLKQRLAALRRTIY
eukprot:GHVU01214024.1.p1 GENE.GHVU01214024.1~~GHVU01214024.1.p1  ORF type:complete len:516 (+),score=32.42 GHVU01214024.1:31-1578(+)